MSGMSGLVDEYTTWMRRAGLAAGTVHHRRTVLRAVEAAAGCAIESVTRDDIERWLERPLAARSRATCISHLAMFFRWAQLEGVLDHDPTVRVVRPRVRPGLPRPIDTVDLRTVLAQSTGIVRPMVHLAALGGLRCMEIAGLDAGDVLSRRDPPVIVVHGKGGRDRVVPAHPIVLAELRRWGLPWRGPVFTEVGRPLPAWRVSRLIGEHLRACEVRATAHQLRHWFATEAYERSGGDLRMVQELLGHASPSTTAVYTAWSRTRASSVVAALSA